MQIANKAALEGARRATILTSTAVNPETLVSDVVDSIAIEGNLICNIKERISAIPVLEYADENRNTFLLDEATFIRLVREDAGTRVLALRAMQEHFVLEDFYRNLE